MAMLDLSQLSGLTLSPNGMLSLPPSQGFEPQQPPVDAAAEAQAAREAAAGRMAGAQKRPAPPFGPFPAVPVPGMQGDLQEAPAPAQPTPQGGSLPPWLQDQVSAPTGIGAFGALSPQAPAAPRKPAGPSLDEMAYGAQPTGDATIPPNATPTAGGPMPGGPAQPIAATAQPAPQGHGFLRSLSNGIQTVAGILDPEVGARNQTAAALQKRGLDPETAMAVARNPEMLKQILPSLFGGKELMNVNGVLVDKSTGKQVADYSEAQKWQIAKVTDPETGIESSVLVQPATGATKQIKPGTLPKATGAGGPATANMTLPAEVRQMPPALQFRHAPEGSTATMGGRSVIRRGGRWEYL